MIDESPDGHYRMNFRNGDTMGFNTETNHICCIWSATNQQPIDSFVLSQLQNSPTKNE